MSRRSATWLAWSLSAFDVVVVAVVLFLPDADGGGAAGAIAAVFFILAFATTGALVASRRPSNPLGWLMCGCALAFTVGAFSVGYSELVVGQGRSDLPGGALAWVGTFVWMLGIGPAATFLLLLFPNGRLPSRRWRPVAWLAGAAVAATVVGVALRPGPIEDTRLSNPVGIPGAEAILSGLEAGGLLALVVALGASIASLVVRFRGAAAEERRQLKWIAYAGPLVALGVAASFVIESTTSSEAAIDLSNAIVSGSIALVPVAIAVAVLRHRLYDIDLVISRTLVYGGLTATLGLTYLGTVLLLQLALAPLTEDSGLAIAGSTLAVAALFGPARACIQRLVDRRFYRRRYDAARTLEGFGARLRDQVDLDSLGGELRGVVRETVQPAHVSLWLRRTDVRR